MVFDYLTQWAAWTGGRRLVASRRGADSHDGGGRGTGKADAHHLLTLLNFQLANDSDRARGGKGGPWKEPDEDYDEDFPLHRDRFTMQHFGGEEGLLLSDEEVGRPDWQRISTNVLGQHPWTPIFSSAKSWRLLTRR